MTIQGSPLDKQKNYTFPKPTCSTNKTLAELRKIIEKPNCEELRAKIIKIAQESRQNNDLLRGNSPLKDSLNRDFVELRNIKEIPPGELNRFLID